QSGPTAAGGAQRKEPRQCDGSRSAQRGARRPVSGGIVAAGHRRWRHAAVLGVVNNAHKRIQNGGWARQVTQADFQVSETIAGVNMRLTAGGVRELHWHVFAEWAFMTYGSCRISVLDPAGHAYVADVNEGDLWFFPAGFPHSLQGLGPDGAEFVLAFDDGHASEFNTLLVTDWIAHTPPDILAQNFAVAPEAFSKTPLQDLYIFQGNLPGPLAADQAAVLGPKGPPRNPFTF